MSLSHKRKSRKSQTAYPQTSNKCSEVLFPSLRKQTGSNEDNGANPTVRKSSFVPDWDDPTPDYDPCPQVDYFGTEV